MRRRGGGGFVAFAHHHPAHIVQHRRARLVAPGGADIDDAALLVGVFACRPITSEVADSVLPG